MPMSAADTATYDLCVVGAGIAGLNALFVAGEYLDKGARVAVIDRNPKTGGMWNDTYGFVRLHQPYRMFTTGDVSWKLDKRPEYLATGGEVVGHLNHCSDVIRSRLDLHEFYGHDMLEMAEIDGDTGPFVKVDYRSLSGGEAQTLIARRVVYAPGLDVPVPPPIELSSSAVRSTTPHLLAQEPDADTAPAYVIGGGKTGLDTVLELLDRNPDRKVVLVNGVGTVFANRDLFLPGGNGRWTKGQPILKTLRDVTSRYDGTNAEEVFDYFRKIYGLSPGGNGERFLFAFLSEDELARVESGVDEIVDGYMADVTDGENGPVMVLRDGTERQIESGALVINCTGHVMRHEQERVPVLSEGGLIMTVSSRAAVHFLTSVSSYFLAHLFFSDKLKQTPLYALDMNEMFRKDGVVYAMAVTNIGFLNTLLLMQALPLKVMDRCGLDLDKWYPMVRRIGSLVDVKLNQKRYIAHCRQSLDRIAETYGVTCAPIEPGRV